MTEVEAEEEELFATEVQTDAEDSDDDSKKTSRSLSDVKPASKTQVRAEQESVAASELSTNAEELNENVKEAPTPHVGAGSPAPSRSKVVNRTPVDSTPLQAKKFEDQWNTIKENMGQQWSAYAATGPLFTEGKRKEVEKLSTTEYATTESTGVVAGTGTATVNASAKARKVRRCNNAWEEEFADADTP